MSAVGLSECQYGGAACVPADWVVLQIGEMTEVSAGGTPATGNESYWFPPEVPWMSSGEVHKRRIFTTEKKISSLGLTHSAAKVFPRKSVVMALAGQGKTRGCVAVLEAEVATNQSLAAIYPSKAFDTDFLFHNLDWRYKELRSLSSGEGGRGGLNLSIIKSVPIGLPPLPEQQKIAAILTAVDDKLDVIARQIEATQTLKQGLMQTLFSRGVGTQDADGRWVPHAEFKDSELGEIPVGWTVAPLGELIEKLMDFRGRTPKKLGMDWGGGDIPALSANNVRMGYIDFDRECYLGSDELYAAWMVQGDTQKNDLVFTMEAPLGNVAVIPDDRKYILSQRVVLLRANQRVKHSYLFQYLRSDTFRKILEANSTGTTAKGIQQKRLVQLPVVVPPPEEQGRIADMLSAIDGKLGALQSKQSHHQTLKRGLMQKLLTGEWRVSLDAIATGA